VRTMADAPAFVRGIARIRGGAVPVIDASRLLDGAAPSAAAPAPRFVSIKTATTRRVALAVDEVLGVAAIEPAQLSDMPPLLARAGGEVVSAIATLDAELLMVLRTSRLVPDDVWAAIDDASAPNTPPDDGDAA
jgi:purine-binding chemotaxis protein CheW